MLEEEEVDREVVLCKEWQNGRMLYAVVRMVV